MRAVSVPSSSGSTLYTVYMHHGKVVDAHAALAGITRAKPVSTCRPNKPNLTNPPACTVGAGLVAPSCAQGAPGNGTVCEGANQPASSSG